MEALWVSLGVVFLAELGDKTQLVALSFGARHRIVLVFSGVVLAQTVTMGLSVLAGGAVGAALPTRVVSVFAAIAFFGFAIWTLARRSDPDRDDGTDQLDARVRGRAGRMVVLTVAIAIFVAELGDKTMLATATLATRQALLWTWIGATIGVVVAGGVAVVAGNVLGSRLPDRVVRWVAATLFAAFGILLLVDAIRG